MSKHNTTASRKSRKTNPDQRTLSLEQETAKAVEAASAPNAEAVPALAAPAKEATPETESFQRIRHRCESHTSPSERCLELLQQERYSLYEMGGLLMRLRKALLNPQFRDRHFDEWVSKCLRMAPSRARSLMRMYRAINSAIDGKRLTYEQLNGVGFSALLALVPIFESSKKDTKVRAEVPRLMDVARERPFRELVAEAQTVRKPTKPGRMSDPMKLLSSALDRVFEDAANPEETVRSIVKLLQKRVIGLRLRITVEKTVLRKRVNERAEEVAAAAAALRDIAADSEADDQDDRDGVTTLAVGKVA